MYRTSIKGRKDLGELLFNDPDSDRIYKIDKSYTSRVAEVFSVILKSLSIGIDFIDDDDIVSLTSDDEINVHTLDGKVLLCTDGLTNMIEDDEIRDIVMQKIFLDKICDQLIERANYYGGKDNIGVVVIEQTLNEV